MPNPSRPPFYYDPPYSFGNGQYTTNQNTFQRLRDADILHGALGKFLQRTTSLRGIKTVHGTADSLVPVSQARTLHQALLSAGLDRRCGKRHNDLEGWFELATTASDGARSVLRNRLWRRMRRKNLTTVRQNGA